MKRRKFFLSLTGGTALGWIGWKSSSTWSALKPKSKLTGRMAKVSRTAHALGTKVSVTVFHPDALHAEQAIDRAFGEMELVEQLMSLYRPDSQLSQLNRNRVLDHPHPYLVEVLKTASELSSRTQGAFDITVQPLYQLYAQGAKSGRLPDQTTISETLKRVDWQRVQVSPHQLRLYGKNTAITLNGIAQGYASDAMIRSLQQSGIENAMIDSGEIGTVGSHIEDRDWSIAIKHPRRPNDFIAVAKIQGRCLATSGDYETRFGDGFTNHHLLDPHTGTSANELSSVSIVAPTALQADALSTAVFVLGLQKGRELVDSTPKVDALFVNKRGHIIPTNEFPFTT